MFATKDLALLSIQGSLEEVMWVNAGKLDIGIPVWCPLELTAGLIGNQV